MTGSLAGKVAVITGAARGQGRNHALRMAAEGADIIAIDLGEKSSAQTPYALAKPTDLSETVKQVEALDRRIVAKHADVRDYAALATAIDEGVATLGRLDIVVANAGILGAVTPLADLEVDNWKLVIDINLTGTFHTAKAAIPHLRRGKQGGAIVLINSISGLRAYPNAGAYVSAKHGLVGLMKGLARELAAESIRVNSIHPTMVPTPMALHQTNFDLFAPGKAAGSGTVDDFAAATRTLHALPVPWVEMDDITEALLFFVSDRGRYVTGVSLPVDAGNNLI